MKSINKFSILGLVCLSNSVFACNPASTCYVDNKATTTQTYILNIVNNLIVNIQNQINQINDTKSYASAGTSGPQIWVAATELPVGFDQNNFPPVNVVHPYNGDSSQFQLTKTGKYQISWYVTVYTDIAGTNNITLQLNKYNPVTPLLPLPGQEVTFDPVTDAASRPRFATISGQTIVDLNAQDVIELTLKPQHVSFYSSSGVLTINQIS